MQGLGVLAGVPPSAYRLDEDKTPYKDITTCNNFYEFGIGKSDPAKNAGSLITRPWTVAIEGEVYSSCACRGA